MGTDRAEQSIATAVEGPPGSGKTTYYQSLCRQHVAASQLVIVPELLAAQYNCGNSDRFYEVQSVHKEQFALALRRHGFSIVMDRCWISTVIMGIISKERHEPRTLISISRTHGAEKSFSTSITSMGATARPWRPPSSPVDVARLSAMSRVSWDIRPA